MLIAATGFAASLYAESTAQKPNVLFIAVDDLCTWIHEPGTDMEVIAPNFKRLMSEGVYFSNAHCASPSCHPSRVAIMTGVSPLKSGITQNPGKNITRPSWRFSPVLEDAVTIPEFFKSQGYSVKGGGKIFHGVQYDAEDELDPADWDEFFPSKTQQIPHQPVPPFDYFAKNKSEGRPAGHFDWTPLKISDEEMSDYKVVDWALNELRQEKAAPFFLAVGFFRPHVPFQVPEKYYELYPDEKISLPVLYPDDAVPAPAVITDQIIGKWGFDEYHWALKTGNLKNALRGYLAGVTFFDTMLGRLLDGLRESQFADNTIIVLWGDNGYHLAEKERFEKFTLWKEATRIPFFIKAPETVAGKTCTKAVSLLDVYPTLVQLTGAAPVAGIDGESLVPWLKNPDLYKQTPAVIAGPEPGSWAAVSEQYRYIHYFNGTEELYDISVDPAEFYNLADQEKLFYVKEYFKNTVPRQIPAFILPKNARPNG